MTEYWIVYRDRENGRQVQYNPLGWYYVTGPQVLDDDEEAVPVPPERVERIEVPTTMSERGAMTVERRLRASLERYGRHEIGCPAAAPFAMARCSCGFHAALADHDALDERRQG